MNTSRLSERIVERLRKEAATWDHAVEREAPRAAASAIERAEIFRVSRPAREPVSVRLDVQDIFLLKRLARRRGLLHSQLLAQWVHERVIQETKRRAG